MVNNQEDNFDFTLNAPMVNDQEDNFDLILSECNFAAQEVEEDLEDLTLEESLSPRLQIVSVTQLDEVVATSLMHHLLILNLPDGLNGNIAFEFLIDSSGRVKQIIVDEEASTFKEAAVIELIKQWLSTWRAPTGLFDTMHLILEIEP
jgi:Ca-activated chloride channel family protein